MSEKKVVDRGIAIALGTICIILIAGLGAAIAYYTMIVNNKNTTYNDYASTHTNSNTEFDPLNASYQNYLQAHSHTNSEYDSLKSQNADLQNQVNSLQQQLNDLASRPSVALNSPDDGLQVACIGMVFRYSVTCVGDSIQNASLWLNASGRWQRVAWNTTVVQNNTENTFTYYFTPIGPSFPTFIGTYVWNVQVYSTETAAFASFTRKLAVYSLPSVKITSMVKEEWWYSAFHEFNFAVQVANSGAEPVDGAVVVIRLYHDPMMISWPVTMYTDEVQDYDGTGNTLHLGTIPSGGNVTESTFLSVDDLCGGMAVPIKYAEATLFQGDSIPDRYTLGIG